MKFYKNLFIMLIILILLTGIYSYLENPNILSESWTNLTQGIGNIFSNKEEKKETKDKENKENSDINSDNLVTGDTIGVFDRTKVTQFKIFNSTSSFILKQKNNIWSIDSGELSQDELDIMVQYLLNLSNLSLVELNPTDLTKYGLDKNTATVIAKVDDKETYKMYLGNQNPDTKEYYLKIEGATKVFKISEQTGNAILKEIKATKVFDFLPENVVRYTVNIVNGSGRNRFVKQNGTWYKIGQDEQYIDLINNNGFKEKINMFADLKIKRNIGVVADLSQYGLDNPEYIIAFNGQGIPQTTLDIGKTENGEVYVKQDNKVFTVDETTIKALLSVEY